MKLETMKKELEKYEEHRRKMINLAKEQGVVDTVLDIIRNSSNRESFLVHVELDIKDDIRLIASDKAICFPSRGYISVKYKNETVFLAFLHSYIPGDMRSCEIRSFKTGEWIDILRKIHEKCKCDDNIVLECILRRVNYIIRNFGDIEDSR